jgi:hypothetical protein
MLSFQSNYIDNIVFHRNIHLLLLKCASKESKGLSNVIFFYHPSDSFFLVQINFKPYINLYDYKLIINKK